MMDDSGQQPTKVDPARGWTEQENRMFERLTECIRAAIREELAPIKIILEDIRRDVY